MKISISPWFFVFRDQLGHSFQTIFLPFIGAITVAGIFTVIYLFSFGDPQTSAPEENSSYWKEDRALDTDGDRIPDLAELAWFGTNPQRKDTDGDGLPDSFEVASGLSPIEKDDEEADPDGDGLTNKEELGFGTFPLEADTDGDGVSDGEEIEAETDPLIDPGKPPSTAMLSWFGPVGRKGVVDSDGDGLSDWEEITIYDTDPERIDTDRDLLFDGFEVLGGTNPRVATSLVMDFDGDGLTTLEEMRLGTSPMIADTDGDGVSDGDAILRTNSDSDGDKLSDTEELVLGTNPHERDTDYDGLPDDFEVRGGLDPKVANNPRADPDGDGLNNIAELLHRTNPSKADSDGNGTLDSDEVSKKRLLPLIPPLPDSDDDGVSDRAEIDRYKTNPLSADSDGDLLPDGFEINGNLDPNTPTDVNADPDGDGLTNLEEYIHHTDPTNKDSDNDGTIDSKELSQGSNPTNDSDDGEAPPPGEIVTIKLTVGDHSGSHSERYNLLVGAIRHQAPRFGVVSTASYSFMRGRTYPITLVHTGTNKKTPDYDYVVKIAAVDSTVAIELIDPDRILGKHDESSYFYAAGKRAFMTILADDDSQETRVSEEEADGREQGEVEKDSAPMSGTIRFLTLTNQEVKPTEVIAIGEPFYLDLELEEPSDESMNVELHWGFDGHQAIELYPLENNSNHVRSARIALRNPTAEVDLALPSSPVQLKDGTMMGRWRIKHSDDETGEVAGVGILSGDPIGATIELRQHGRSFFLTSLSVVELEETLSLRLRGRLPELYRPPPRFISGTLGERAGQAIEVSHSTDWLEVTNGNDTIGVRVDGPYSHVIHINLTKDGGELNGTWEKKSSDGTVLAAGKQVWEKADPEIEGIVVLNDQTAFNVLGPVYPYPFDNPGVEPGGNKSRTLVIYGRNLPQNWLDPLEIDALGAPILYSARATRASASALQKLEFKQAWDKLPPDIDRGPDAILVNAQLQPGVLPGIQPLRLNGMLHYWPLEFGDSHGDVRFVRSTSGSEFETTEFVMSQEHVYLQVKTAGRLPMDEISLRLAKNGEQVSFGGSREVVAKRHGNLNSKLYLTPPILLHKEGRRERSAPSRSDELPLFVAKDDRLLAVPVHSDRLRVEQPASVQVINSPSNIGTLWKDALKRVAACYNIDDIDWRTVGRTEVDSISNVIVFALEWRTTSIRLHEQAAMILLRDVFVEMLGKVRTEFIQIRASDQNVRKFQRFMSHQTSNDRLPFNNVEITFPDDSTGKFVYLYNSTIVNWYRAGLSDLELEWWAFEQTKNALDRFIETMSSAVKRAQDAGDCDGPELLELSGAGFDRVIDRLLPRLMTLEEGSGGNQYWIPDRMARASVKGVSSLAMEVKAQQELSNIDNTMIVMSVAAVSVGAGAVLGEGILGLVVSLGIDAADIAFTIATEVPEYLASKREVEFVIGGQMVVSAERVEAANSNEKSWYGVATSVLGSGMGGAFSAYRAASKATRLVAVKRGASLLEQVSARGIESLSEVEKLDFKMFMINTHMRKGTDAAKLSELERNALQWGDNAPKRAAEEIASRVVKGDANPVLVERLQDVDNRRVIEQTSEQLGGRRFTERQVERMLEAHNHGKQPYDHAALKRKMILLTEDPPAGAGLTRDQASNLMRRGIMGNAQPNPMSILETKDRGWLNKLKKRRHVSRGERKRVAGLWRKAEKSFRGGATNSNPINLRAVEDAIQTEIIAGRITPDIYNDLVHRFDNIIWELQHNGRAANSQRVRKLRKLAEAELEGLNLPNDVQKVLFARLSHGITPPNLRPQLFRGGSPDSFKPRSLDVERLPDGIQDAFRGKRYRDPWGKTGNSMKSAEMDMQVDHIFPVALIQELPGFWRITPEGRRALLHFDNNLQALPASFNASKGGKLASEWKASSNISDGYYRWLQDEQFDMESRLTRMLSCMLSGGSPEDCSRRVRR